MWKSEHLYSLILRLSGWIGVIKTFSHVNLIYFSIRVEEMEMKEKYGYWGRYLPCILYQKKKFLSLKRIHHKSEVITSCA